MRLPRYAAFALAAAALLAPRPALPQTIVGARAFGGYNTYAMGDWNDIRRGLFIPASLFSQPKDGSSWGVGAELAVRPSLSFTVSYERLIPGRMTEILGQKTQLPANAVLLELEYRRRLRARWRLGVGGGLGYYQLGEETESPVTARNYEGQSMGGQAFGFGEWDLASAVSIGLDVGYRSALVEVSKVNHNPPFTAIDMDYSGLTTRLVLRFLPGRHR